MRPLSSFRLFCALFVAAVVAGCAAGPPGGRWEIEPEVQQMFESGRVLPEHTYFYLGSYNAPDSIIAISTQYTLRTRVWAQVDLTDEMLNRWLQWYRTEHYPAGCEYRGGVILTPDGRQAGFWYSRNIINIIRLPEPGVIEVYQPHSISGGVCGHPNDDTFMGGRE
jgi:hypothetical protein